MILLCDGGMNIPGRLNINGKSTINQRI